MGTENAERFWVIRVSAAGRADFETGPAGPFSLGEALQYARSEPDPLSGWRDLIVTEYVPHGPKEADR